MSTRFDLTTMSFPALLRRLADLAEQHGCSPSSLSPDESEAAIGISEEREMFVSVRREKRAHAVSEERAAVVGMLRARAHASELHEDRAAAELVTEVADAIERGDHVRNEGAPHSIPPS